MSQDQEEVSTAGNSVENVSFPGSAEVVVFQLESISLVQ